MSSPTTFPGDVIVPGNLRVGGSITPTLERDQILAIEERVATLPWSLFRIHDNIAGLPPAAAASDDLGLVAGALGTNFPSLQSVDFGGTSTTAYIRGQIPVPADYVAGQTFKIRFHAGMLVVADTTCTLDIVCYKSDTEDGVGADLASAAVANNIKSATFADVDFTITSTSLSPGDFLDVRIVITGVDAGNAAPLITAVIGLIQLVYNGR
jgi:hypothetical protein